jgi:hypothetical protein
VVNSFPINVPLFFDVPPTCPSDIYDLSFGSWEANPHVGCVNCNGPLEPGADASLYVYNGYGPQEVCYTHTCSSSNGEIADLQMVCCTTVSASLPPCANTNIRCDFSTLTPGVPLTDASQAQKLREACYMTAQSYGSNHINVFNSSDIPESYSNTDLASLGSPNRNCPNKGPGRGRGGWPTVRRGGQKVQNRYANCNPLGNLLIIQNEDGDATLEANASPSGGCMYFSFFQRPATLNGIGLLDIEEGATVEVSFGSVVCFIILVFARRRYMKGEKASMLLTLIFELTAIP